MYSLLLKVIFTLSLFILLFISGISYKHSTSLSTSTELLVHSYKIQMQLEQISSYIKDAETGQRGYIITHDSIFLDPYIHGLKKVNESFLVLKDLTANQPQQQVNLEELSQLIELRFKLLGNSLAVISGTEVRQLLGENMVKGKRVMDAIRLQINKMVELEMSYFKNHQTKYYREISFTPLITLVLLLFTLIVFILAFIKINRDLIKLKNSNDELLISNESIKHAEIIGEFCTTIWNLKTNNLIFSDNLFRLLGCEPQSFEPTIENFLKFVHPDDRDIVTNGAMNLITNQAIYSRYYRIIRKDKELRYFSSIGKIITDYSGNSTHIGVIKDITQEHLNSLILKERNRELEQNNIELASFNQIASHDLQEPLRKIQIFTSRISDIEISTMSERMKEYFTKIQISVGRMRKLIDDLLMFSRTSKIDKAFKETDLNLLLINTINELSQTIEEKNAEIQHDNLPFLKVIPFQIQQLFQNLLSNSLKYSKPDVKPIIRIDCEKILAKNYPELKTDPNKFYYRISVRDNGLGFEQQYAEKLFIIFSRLHISAEYPGTGIGLSICKKIVEIHSGFIFAEGQPDIGAVFTVFLPAEELTRI